MHSGSQDANSRARHGCRHSWGYADTGLRLLDTVMGVYALEANGNGYGILSVSLRR